MPNHCANLLRISGPKQKLDRFQEFARGINPFTSEYQEDEGQEMLSLHKFMPVPNKILRHGKDTNDAFNGGGGYDWCCRNWGTKWGCYDESVESDGDDIVYRFSTARTPPNEEVIYKMAEKFPELEFHLKYGECGAGFYGYTRAAVEVKGAGPTLDHETYSIEESDYVYRDDSGKEVKAEDDWSESEFINDDEEYVRLVGRSG